ncbi:MAG TPA: DUF3108 domain-containing protein [Vicinamibacterales bacterium]|nr:DUF3108 domain-containing protein [Vicinamibacterales bacterium]
MTRKDVLTLALACLAGAQVIFGQSARTPAPTARAAAKPLGEVRVPFKAGELLTYDVSYSTYVTAGTVTLNVQSKRPSYNSLAYYVVAEARPTPLMSKLYTLYYKADVLMDVYTLLPQRAGVYSEEGQRHQMKVTTFNNAARKATFENVTAKNGKRDLNVPAFTQDALSAIYVIRALPLKIGARETIPVSTGGHAYRAQVSVEASDALKTPAGPFQAFRIRTTVFGEDGRPNGRPIHLWISDTPSRLPIKLQSDLAVGSFVLTLSQARLGQ